MNIGNREDMFKKYDDKFEELRKALTQLLIDFDRKDLSLSSSDHPKYIIRDSIFYRAKCIRFHLDLIFQVYKSVLEKCASNFPQKDNHEVLSSGKNQIMFVFDDIVFHICSMFDYVGNLVGLLYIGRNKMKMKWNGAAKSAMHDENKLSEKLVADIIEKEHREWIDHLFGYRSRLIHHKKDNTGGKQTINFGKEEVNIELQIDAPEMFMKMIKSIPKEEIEEKELSIADIALWLSKRSLTVINDIVKTSKKELEPKIKEELDKKYEKLKEEKPHLFEDNK